MKESPTKTHPVFLVPEVIQSSAMDCGPAALKSMLEGWNIPVSYGRLREACQTDVDGTSIDTLEEVFNQLGLEAEQVMIPPDHLLLPEARALPALLVVRLASGMTHFVVVWRRLGPLVLVMDPANGRHWITLAQLKAKIYKHAVEVPASGWREWAGSDEFIKPLKRRLVDITADTAQAGQLVQAALQDSGWHALAALDASTRMTAAILASKGLTRGQVAGTVLGSLFEKSCQELDRQGYSAIVPAAYWTVRPVEAGVQDAAVEDDEQLVLQGAVLIRVLGKRPAASATDPGAAGAPLSHDLRTALDEKPFQPAQELKKLLVQDGLRGPLMLLLALLLAAAGLAFEALLFRNVLNLLDLLNLREQQVAALAALMIFFAGLFTLEFFAARGVRRVGRRLETRLRILFLQKIPRLGDKYFRSRLVSDMAERSHNVHQVREMPELMRLLIWRLAQVVTTAGGMIWLFPQATIQVLLLCFTTIGIPLLVQPAIIQGNLRLRSHQGALSRFYLDAMLGLTAIRAHRAEKAVQQAQESLVVEWARAYMSVLRIQVPAASIQVLLSLAVQFWMLALYLVSGRDIASSLLLIYWASEFFPLGWQIADSLQKYPTQRNIMLRLFEPLGAPDESSLPETALSQPDQANPPGPAVRLDLAGVSVQAAGHSILHDINLTIEPGEHLAVVGKSGAGKSSLVGLLLGWHRPAEGHVLVDGQPLDGNRLAGLRRETAWVDPTIQLWNRSLLDNLLYAQDEPASQEIGQVIEQADLVRVLQNLPEALQTRLGEGGGLVSGGEGQRVRLGRALLQPGVRLVILDEPFRGLTHTQRRTLLNRVRQLWQGVTLLCITHDVTETLDFERALVLSDGRIVEDGNPGQLLAQPDSHYSNLVESEDRLWQEIWGRPEWRKLRLEDGVLLDQGSLVQGPLPASQEDREVPVV
jgi:ABC-type bacteriocin/lantibiotic exporter with double-glycine peptidase domain